MEVIKSGIGTTSAPHQCTNDGSGDVCPTFGMWPPCRLFGYCLARYASV